MSLCRSPSAFSVSGSACRRACSSGSQPHRAQRTGASFAYGQALPCFGSPHASRGLLSFFLACQTSWISIPYLDRMNLRFRRYSLVRVGLVFTSSTTSFPPNLYEKSAVYRTARMRSPASVM